MNTNRKGQVLIETLVAIFIFVIVMVSIYSLMSVAKRIGDLSVQKMMAEGYVQDGMEKVRNIRDENLKTPGMSFDQGLFPGCSGLGGEGVCGIEPNGGTPVRFRMTSGVQPLPTSGFEREITIKKPGNDLEVEVTVFWNDRSKQIKATELLTDWK